jgi:RNA polymerase sigma-70 factor, ECF subfamily
MPADGMSKPSADDWDWSLIRKRCSVEAARILRRSQDADEVVQEALTRAWRNRRSCRTPEAPLPWCLQITRNEAFRLIARRPVPEPLETASEREDERARREPERVLGQVDVRRALQVLTPQEQLLIALRYVHDWSHPEIAERLQIPEATARVRLHRARKRLKTMLDVPA